MCTRRADKGWKGGKNDRTPYLLYTHTYTYYTYVFNVLRGKLLMCSDGFNHYAKYVYIYIILYNLMPPPPPWPPPPVLTRDLQRVRDRGVRGIFFAPLSAHWSPRTHRPRILRTAGSLAVFGFPYIFYFFFFTVKPRWSVVYDRSSHLAYFITKYDRY